MALTATQRQVVQRNDLGGDALLALLDKDYVVSAIYTADIGATSIIPTAFTATLPAALARIILIPRGAVYIKVGGAASALTALVPLTGLDIPVTATLAATIQIFAAAILCDLLVCTPRN